MAAWLDGNGAIWTDGEIEDLRRHSPLDPDTFYWKILTEVAFQRIPDLNQCREFLWDFRGTVYHDTEEKDVASWTETEIAERMHISVPEASKWEVAIIAWGLSERQGGGLVI